MGFPQYIPIGQPSGNVSADLWFTEGKLVVVIILRRRLFYCHFGITTIRKVSFFGITIAAKVAVEQLVIIILWSDLSVSCRLYALQGGLLIKRWSQSLARKVPCKWMRYNG